MKIKIDEWIEFEHKGQWLELGVQGDWVENGFICYGKGLLYRGKKSRVINLDKLDVFLRWMIEEEVIMNEDVRIENNNFEDYREN